MKTFQVVAVALAILMVTSLTFGAEEDSQLHSRVKRQYGGYGRGGGYGGGGFRGGYGGGRGYGGYGGGRGYGGYGGGYGGGFRGGRGYGGGGGGFGVRFVPLGSLLFG